MYLRRLIFLLLAVCAVAIGAPIVVAQTQTVFGDRLVIGTKHINATDGDGTVSGRLSVGTTGLLSGVRLRVLGDTRLEGGDLLLGGSTTDQVPIIWQGTLEAGPPTFTARSAGTRAVYFPFVSPTSADFAAGVESDGLWWSLSGFSGALGYRWYAGTTPLARLRGDGRFTLLEGPGIFPQGIGGESGVHNIPVINQGGTASRLVWPNNVSIGPPTTSTRSLGTRAVWRDGFLSSTQSEYATGVEGGILWNSVPGQENFRFRWYGADHRIAQLTGFGTLELDADLLPLQPYSGFIGYPNRKWLTAWIAELNVETLVAHEVMATIGGRIITAPTSQLLRPALPTDSQLVIAHNNVQSGDFLIMEGQLAFEALRSTGAATLVNRILEPAFELGVSNWSGASGQTVDQQCDQMSTADPSLPLYVQGRCVLRWIFGSSTDPPRIIGVTATLSASTSYTFCAAMRAGGPASPNDITASDVTIRIGGPGGVGFVQPDLVRRRDDQPEWFDVCLTAATPGSPVNDVRIAPDPGLSGQWRLDEVRLYLTSLGPLPWSANGSIVPVARDLDGTGANHWPAGSAVLNTGTCGQGFIDQYAIRGLRSGTEFGPSIVGNVRTACSGAGDFNAWEPRWAAGNLRGLYDYGGDIFGFAAGDPSARWLAIDPSNGFRLMDDTFTRMQLSGTNLDFFASTGILRTRLGANLTMFDNAGTERVSLTGSSGNLQLGSPSDTQIQLIPGDSANTIRLRIGGINRITIGTSPSNILLRDASGSPRITLEGDTGNIIPAGDILGGSATGLDSGTGYYLGASGSVRVGTASGNRFRFDGSNTLLKSDNLEIGIGSTAMRLLSTTGSAPSALRSIVYDMSASGSGADWMIGAYRNTSGAQPINLDITAVGSSSIPQALRLRTVNTTGTAEVLLQSGNTSTGSATEINLIADRISLLGQLGHPGHINATVSTSQANWNPTGLSTTNVIRMTVSSPGLFVHGLVAQPIGTRLVIHNVSDTGVCLPHQSATATAANRFLMPADAHHALGRNGSVEFWYDTTSSRWRTVGATNFAPNAGCAP